MLEAEYTQIFLLETEFYETLANRRTNYTDFKPIWPHSKYKSFIIDKVLFRFWLS